MVQAVCKLYQKELPLCGVELLEKILERDRESSVGFPSGLAIPHVRLDGFNDTVICLSFLRQPLDFAGTRVSWIALIISDKASSKLYLNIVAALMRASKNPEFIHKVFACNTSHDIYVAFDKEQINIGKELHLSDIMTTHAITVSPEATMAELNTLINKYGHAVFPVVDDDSRFVGEVHIINLLKTGIPDYLLSMDNLNFLQTFEPLEKIFEQEYSLYVKEFMDKEPPTIEPTASIIEAVSMMIQHQKRFFCVVEDKRLKGIITAKDIFRKVIKA